VIGDGRIWDVDGALQTLASADGRTYRAHSENTYPSGPYSFTVTHQVEVRAAGTE
jgi:hypothetical protein